MPIRVPWEEQETAILISACIEFNNGKISKEAAIANVSNLLRRRAEAKGITIDDVFRNKNGIAMQFAIVNGLLKQEECGLHTASKMFVKMVNLYRNEQTEFQQILKEARDMSDSTKSIQDSFSKWLSAQLTPAQMSEIYITYYDMDVYLQKWNLLKKPLLEITDLNIVENLLKEMTTNKAFRNSYRAHINKYYRAVELYRNWLLQTNLSFANTKTEIIPENSVEDVGGIINKEHNENVERLSDDSELMYVRYDGSQSYKFMQVEYFEYFGEKKYNIDTWYDLYAQVYKCLARDYPEILKKHSSILVGYSADAIVNKIRKLLELCNLNQENLVIAYRHKIDDKSIGTDELNSHTLETNNSVEKSSEINNKELFLSWLKDKGIQKSDLMITKFDMSRMSNMAVSRGITDKDLYEIESPAAFKMIGYRLQRSSDFLKLDLRLQKQYKGTLERYLEFLYSIGPDDNEKMRGSQTTPEEKTEWDLKLYLEGKAVKYVDMTLETGWFWVIGGQEIQTVITECRIHNIFFQFCPNAGKIANGHAAWRTRHIPKSVLRDRPKSVEENESKPDFIVAESPKAKISYGDDIQKKIIEILSSRFEDGYKLESIIFRNRFKLAWQEKYGGNFTLSDEDLEKELRVIGEIRDGRVFVKKEENKVLIEQILNDIFKVFENGGSCVYLEAVYSRYSSALVDELQIYDEDVLAETVIKSSKGKLRRVKTFLCLNGRTSDTKKDVINVFRNSHIGLTYSDLDKILWYIPLAKVKYILVTTKSIVQVAPETYFYAENLPISKEETTKLITVIKRELEYSQHITNNDLYELIKKELPNVAINTAEYTISGLCNCLGYILRNQFSFKGQIISSIENNIGMEEIFVSYCREHEKITLDEIEQVAKENNTLVYWDTVRRETVRISDADFLRDDLIDFPIDEVDAVLDTLCDGDYIALKNVGLFMHFPAIGVPWNGYVLESYLYCYSRKFKLLHSSFSTTDFFGAMVRIDSKIEDYTELLVEVLAKSDAWDNKKSALEYIVAQGYQRNKKNSNIDAIMKIARINREKMQ